MAVKQTNIFSGGDFSNQIVHDRLTGRCYRRSVIDTIKEIRKQLNIYQKASAKDVEISREVSKALADQGIQQIDSVFGKFTNIKVSERQAGDGMVYEAIVSLTDTDTGEVDQVVMDLTGAGAMGIFKLNKIDPGEEIELKMFTLVNSTREDGSLIVDEKGQPTSYVNHIATIVRSNGEKITLENDPEHKALKEALDKEGKELTAKKATKTLRQAALADIRVQAAIKIAHGVEEKVKAYRASNKNESDVAGETFTDDDMVFGEHEHHDDGEGFVGGNKPAPK